MPILSRIIVYPVKSLDGLSVERCQVLPSGALACDRRFALRDSEGNFINGKRFPAIHGLRLEEFAQAAGLSAAEELVGGMSSDECRMKWVLRGLSNDRRLKPGCGSVFAGG